MRNRQASPVPIVGPVQHAPFKIGAANEKLVGKNLINLKEQSGKGFIKEFVAVANGKGEGWLDLRPRRCRRCCGRPSRPRAGYQPLKRSQRCTLPSCSGTW